MGGASAFVEGESMNAKRKRGRPRKSQPIGPPARVRMPFSPLPAQEPKADDVAALASVMRHYVQKRPHISDIGGDLQKWLDAAAEALERGNAFATAYYTFGAMRLRAFLAYQEPRDVESVEGAGALTVKDGAKIIRDMHKDGNELTLFELAELGRATLQSDKRRGRRT